MSAENQFEFLISELSNSSDHLDQLIHYLQPQTDNSSTFISQSFQSLLTLEHWVWNSFTEKFNRSNDLEFFHALAAFNFQLIFHAKEIDAESKGLLLLPKTTDLLDQIFDQITQIDDDNAPFLNIISHWFDNLAYLIHEYTQLETSPIIIHLCQHIGHHYLLTDQYKFYLTQLHQPQLPQSIFTNKQLFYLRTCSFLFRMFICSKLDKYPFKGDELLNRYGNDYLQIILAHSHTVQSWNKELVSCIAHLIDFICACCWWAQDRAIYLQILVSSEQLFYDYIQALIHIVGYRTFHEQITSQWSNDETILIDSSCIFLIGALFQMKNLSCFIRSETILSNIILEIAQKSSYDRISICAYGILAEILSDEQLREVKITDNISEFFFRTLELAWNHPTQCYRRLPIAQLLTGFLTLAKNDVIQEKTARLNKISLLIEMSEKYPITLNILWSLSFNAEIQEQLRSNRSFMGKLALLKEESNNEKMRKMTFGILWNLEKKPIDRTPSETAMFDIMISYSHKDETICKQIYEELVKAGYRVWIDFDQMHGNVMDAMAQAIERSQMVIICMSEQYRRSNYCRAEAHYAFQRQLRIVPILLQEHYQPDGWLLFLVGQLLYVDFTKYEFPQAIEKLIEELRSSMGHGSQAIPVQPPEDSTFTAVPSLTLPENMLDWTEVHVHNWLIEHNLRQMARLLSDFDGSSLNSLAEFIIQNDSHQILTLFQEDALRRLNENISLLELARLRSLLRAKHEPVKKNNFILNSFSYCQLM